MASFETRYDPETAHWTAAEAPSEDVPTEGTSVVPSPTPEDAGKFVAVNTAGDGFELAPGSVSGASDYAYWKRLAVADETSGSFDFTADLIANHGTSIDLDDSTEWVAGDVGWGYAVPRVVEGGVYAFYLLVRGDIVAEYQISLMDDQGSHAADLPYLYGTTSLVTADTDARGSLAGCLTLAAGTHVDVGLNGITPNRLEMTITRVI